MESQSKTNPTKEVDTAKLSMFDVMFGSEDASSTNQEDRQAKRTTAQYSEDLETNGTETEDSLSYDSSSTDDSTETQSVEYASEEDGENTTETGDTEAEEVLTEPSSKYRVKVDGNEFEVSLDELRNGYQRQADYTRKSQSLAELRKAYEANLSAVQQEREKYGKALESFGQAQSSELQKYANIDWNSLKENDPMQYMEKKLEYQEAREKFTQLQAERQRVMQKNRQEFQNIVTQKVQEEAQKLATALPEFVSPNSNLKNDLRNYAIGLGFTDQDIDSITDHRVVLVLHKAMQQDKAAKSVPDKKIKTVPKVVKAGIPESKEGRDRKVVQQRREQLAKTGNMRDATRVMMDILNNPKPKR